MHVFCTPLSRTLCIYIYTPCIFWIVKTMFELQIFNPLNYTISPPAYEKLLIFLTKYTSVFRMIFATSSDYFHKQN